MVFTWEAIQALKYCEYKAWKLASDDNGSRIVNGAIRLPAGSLPDHTHISALHLLSGGGNVKLTVHVGEAVSTWDRPSQSSQVRQLVESARALAGSQDAPRQFRISQCGGCTFEADCMRKLKQRDCLSLLSGMRPHRVRSYNDAGILTIRQLAHTFRPSRRKSINPQLSNHALKALAIRDNKTYVWDTPAFETGPAIFMDFEGTPNSHHQYLIGMIVRDATGTRVQHSFWANGSGDIRGMYLAMLETCEGFPDARIYHYGAYEAKALRAAQKKFRGDIKERIAAVLERMVDLHPYLNTHIYPPIYRNTLKELGAYLGHRWRADLGGRDVQTVRNQWELKRKREDKLKLISYNLDDCKALMKFFDFMSSHLKRDRQVARIEDLRMGRADGLDTTKSHGRKYRKIAQSAYFDYQVSKISFPKGEGFKKRQPKKVANPTFKTRRTLPVDQYVTATRHANCRYCGSNLLSRTDYGISRNVVDLHFSERGVSREVTKHTSGRYTCRSCWKSERDYLVDRGAFGPNFYAWAIHMYVTYNINKRGLARLAGELFGIPISENFMKQTIPRMMSRWKPVYDYLFEVVRLSDTVHLDETNFKLRYSKGYVWVFATADTVFYRYAPDRKTENFMDFAKGYRGTIVTDFYAAYGSHGLRHQKCLLHLMRDMNKALFRNQQDRQFETLVVGFRELMIPIIRTVDAYGLQTQFLSPHLNDVGSFYAKYLEHAYTSRLASKFAKRLRKEWDTLWTFLEADGVPWNNILAENAFASLTDFRSRINGQMSEAGLNEYLMFLSIAQTCKRRGIPFVDLLRGERGIWENIESKRLPKYLPYSQAKLYVRKLQLNSEDEWDRWKSSRKRPKYVPKDPKLVYADKGWNHMAEWLGH